MTRHDLILNITVNGSLREVEQGASLVELLSLLDLDPRTVVVEHNREIVRRPELPATHLAEGDTVELVHFVGGG